MHSAAFFGPFCAFASSVTWAIGSAGYSKMSEEHSAFAVNFTRALVALPIFVLASFLMAGGQGVVAQFAATRPWHIGWLGLSMVASYGLGDTLFLWSTRSLGVPSALAIASCYPLWTALEGAIFQGEHLTLHQTLGLVLTVGGIIAIILHGPYARKDGTPSLAPSHAWRGVLLALATSFMWMINSVSVSRGGQGISPFVANAIRMVFALALTFGFCRVITPKASVRIPTPEIRRWLWLIVLEAFGGSAFFMYGLAHSPLAIGATLASLAPALSVPVAWAARMEKFSLPRTLGVLVVVAGVCLLMT